MVSHHAAVERPAKPLVSVCVANYNGEELLPDCLESLRNQQVDFPFEIIVHDDASSDESLTLLRNDYPDVEVLASNHNVGFCVANNRMVAHARGHYVLLLNNDAALFPDALALLHKEASRYPAGAILTMPQFDWETGDIVDRGSLLDPFYNPVPNLDPDRRHVAMAIGACLWIPREEWNRLGGFPEWLESIGEDLYLCCAARLRGLKVRALPSSGFRHRQGHTFGGNKPTAGRLMSTFQRRRLSERNKTFVLVIMTPTPLVWPLLVMHLVLLALEGAALSVLKRDARIWKDVYGNVFIELWQRRRRLLRQRNDMQASRVSSLAGYLRGFTVIPRKLSLLLRYGSPEVKD